MVIRGRKVWLTFHRWLGIVLGVIIAAIGVSGSALVFEREIDTALYPQLLQVEPTGALLPFDDIVQAAANAYPGWSPYFFQRRSDDPRESFKVVLRDEAKTEKQVFVNPYTAQVLGERSGLSPVALIRRIHGDLVLGEPVGDNLVGVLSFVCVAFFIAGIVLWWPAKGGLRRALSLSGNTEPKRLMRELHNVFGIWPAVFFLIAAVTVPPLVWMGSGEAPPPPPGAKPQGGPPPGAPTGAPAIQSGPPPGERPQGAPPPGERPQRPPSAEGMAPPPGAPTGAPATQSAPPQPLTWQAAADFAAPEAPGQYVGFILRNPGPRGIYMVRFWPQGTTGADKQSNVIMPITGGRIIRVQRPAPVSVLSITKTDFAATVHSGAVLGLPGRVVMFLAGICFPVLFGTGIVMWLLGRRRTT